MLSVITLFIISMILFFFLEEFKVHRIIKYLCSMAPLILGIISFGLSNNNPIAIIFVFISIILTIYLIIKYKNDKNDFLYLSISWSLYFLSNNLSLIDLLMSCILIELLCSYICDKEEDLKAISKSTTLNLITCFTLFGVLILLEEAGQFIQEKQIRNLKPLVGLITLFYASGFYGRFKLNERYIGSFTEVKKNVYLLLKYFVTPSVLAFHMKNLGIFMDLAFDTMTALITTLVGICFLVEYKRSLMEKVNLNYAIGIYMIFLNSFIYVGDLLPVNIVEFICINLSITIYMSQVKRILGAISFKYRYYYWLVLACIPISIASILYNQASMNIFEVNIFNLCLIFIFFLPILILDRKVKMDFYEKV